MRNLRTLDGESVALSPALQLLRDGQTEGTPLESRQQHFDRLFEHTETAGIARDDIQVMWDFHTASETSLHSPVLSLWNAALEVTGEDGPELIIDAIEPFLAEADGMDSPTHPHIAYRIEAHITVPRFVKQSEPAYDTVGWILNEDENGNVTQNGTMEVPILIGVPRSAISGTPQTLWLLDTEIFKTGPRDLTLILQEIVVLRARCRAKHIAACTTPRVCTLQRTCLAWERSYDTTIPIMLLDLSLFPGYQIIYIRAC